MVVAHEDPGVENCGQDRDRRPRPGDHVLAVDPGRRAPPARHPRRAPGVAPGGDLTVQAHADRTTSSRYDRPYRPRPVALANRVGTALRRVGVEGPSFSIDALVEAARRSTGLADFGDEGFREPLGVLVDSIEGEARLTPLGRVITRNRLVGLLSNRLRVEALIAAHPEILDEEIDAPVVIAGLQLSGQPDRRHLPADHAAGLPGPALPAALELTPWVRSSRS